MWYFPLDTIVVARVDLDRESVVLAIALVVLVGLGVWGILWVQRWVKHGGEAVHSNAEELANLERLFDQGLLTQEEFNRARCRLAPPQGSLPPGGESARPTAPPGNPTPPPPHEPPASRPTA